MSNDLIKTIDASTFKKMLICGCDEISKNYEYINDLNVFPVPDGDTGTNMKLTFEGGKNSILNLDGSIYEIGKIFSRNLLMNARGNSGVISSQIFKGFCNTIKNDQTSLTIDNFIDAFKNAKIFSYNSVLNPVEGTILTVVRVISEKLEENKTNFDSINSLFKFICETANETANETINMLPQLKEANVIDSGAYGLTRMLIGMYESFEKKEIVKKEENVIKKKHNLIANINDNNDGFGYCTEFIMSLGSKVTLEQQNKEKFDIKLFKDFLNKSGDSIVLVNDEEIIKVHIHTIKPYKVLEFASKYGEFNSVKIENMTLQFLKNNSGTTLEDLYKKNNKDSNWEKNVNHNLTIITTVPSQEINDIFVNNFNIKNNINTKYIGNPSISVFFEEIKKANSSNIILIIDDSNYKLSADEAIKLLPKNIKCQLFVTKNISLTYLICEIFNPHIKKEQNIKNIWKILYNDTYVFSYSVKDIVSNNLKINKDDLIMINNKKIIVNAQNNNFTSFIDKCISKIKFNKQKKKCLIFYGEEGKLENAQIIADKIKILKNIDSKIIFGNQKTYNYILTFY